ncbi:MAG: hypothetical protein U0T81_00400 [Saprospiraceae bacterium]
MSSKEHKATRKGAIKAYEKIRDEYAASPDANGMNRFILVQN